MTTPTDNAGTLSDCLWLFNPSGESTDAITLGQGLPSEIHGEPVKYLWSDAAGVGDFAHPTTGQPFKIDRKRIDHWVENFSRMTDKGIDVPIVADHKELSTHSRGWIKGARRNGDTFQLLHQFIGADAIRDAARNRISVKIAGKYTDGKRNTFEDVITHSALTPIPVITGQSGFIAASRDPATDAPFLILAASTNGGAEMALTPAQVQQIQKLPGASDVTADTGVDWLLSYAAKATTDGATLLSRVTAVEAERDAEKAKVLTLSREDKPVPDPEILRDRAELYAGKIELSMARGELTPTIAKKLLPLVKLDAPSVFMLSRNDDAGTRPLDFILDLFKGEKLTPVGKELSGVQLLARQVPNDQQDEPAAAGPHPLMAHVEAMSK